MIKMIAWLLCVGLLSGGSHATDFKTTVYRVEIITPGGPLAFVMSTGFRSDGSDPFGLGGMPLMIIHNDSDRIETEHVAKEWTGFPAKTRNASDRVIRRERAITTVSFPQYESELVWTAWHGIDVGPQLGHYGVGVWRKRRSDATAELPALVTELPDVVSVDNAPRFAPLPPEMMPQRLAEGEFAGRWEVRFESSTDPAVGIFEVNADHLATGTFLTPTGDYRYLAGRVDGDLMRLSTFDGAHAFLFHARMQPDGTIAGDFWSGNWHHATWTAARDDSAALPDAFTQTTPTGAGVDDLAFRDLSGTPTRVTELLNAGNAPARILYIFGSWCPNCADAGAEMKRLKAKYGDRLTIVGLAFEQTEDFPRSARQVGLYAERHGADWPVLIAGLADKAKASAELPVLDRVRAYPTTIFLNAANEIGAVHTGFSGPATGQAHAEQQAAFETLVDGLIGP